MALWGNKDSKTASGTIAIADTGVVTGSSTSFTTQAKIGNYIRAGGVDYEIVKITSNTVAKVRAGTNGAAIAVVSGGTSYTLSEKPAYVGASEASNISGWAGAGKAEAVYGVDTTEQSAGGDNVSDVSIIQGGTQYAEAPTVTFSGGGGSGAAATATISGGKVTAIAVTNTGSSYETVPTVSMNAPTITFDASSSSVVSVAANTITYNGHRLNTGDSVTIQHNDAGRIRGDVVTVDGTSSSIINVATNIITAASHPFLTGEEVYYEKSGSNAIGGLTNQTSYYIHKITDNSFALYDTYAHAVTHDGTGLKDLTAVGNGATDTFKYVFNENAPIYVIKTTANAFKLARTAALATAGTAIDISAIFGPAGTPGTQIILNSGAATATAVKGSGGTDGANSAMQHVTHAGWVRKTVGTGGRAGRVQYETLVAMGSITGDQSDDIQFRDS